MGTFTNIPTISATLYEGMHTYLNTYGQIFQETQDTYLDGTSPVLISFRTGWFNMAGLQGLKEHISFIFWVNTSVPISYKSALRMTITRILFKHLPSCRITILQHGVGIPYGDLLVRGVVYQTLNNGESSYSVKNAKHFRLF